MRAPKSETRDGPGLTGSNLGWTPSFSRNLKPGLHWPHGYGDIDGIALEKHRLDQLEGELTDIIIKKI